MGITPPDYPGELRTGDPAPQVRVPNSLITAALLMWLGAIGYAVACVFGVLQTLGNRQEIRESFSDGMTTYSEAELDRMLFALVFGTVFTGIITALLWVWMAWVNGQGRRWARNTATALGAVNISILILAIAFGAPGLLGVVAWFTVIVGALTIALLWNKDSSAYYRAVRIRGTLPPGSW